MTKAELRTARENGTSLAQLATQQGKSVAGLKQAIYDAAKADLDKAVAAGRITAAQETSMLATSSRTSTTWSTRPARPSRASAGRVARPSGRERLRSAAATVGPWPLPSSVTTSSSSTSSRSRTAATASRG